LEDFIFENPTRIIFGKGTYKDTGKEVSRYSKRVLFHYGMGSIKRSGLYEKITSSLQEYGIEVFELAGAHPDPRLSLTIEGARICRAKNIDFILAVGGGSVIDSAKAIALNVPYGGESMWDFVTGKARPCRALPVGAVPTIPAAGSESSDVAVITRDDGLIKRGYHHKLIYPVFAILDPQLTFTLPPEQLASGAADIMAHVMERYFTRVKNVDLTSGLCEAVMKTVINNAPLALKDPKDYVPRAELMWASTLAHNNLLDTGRIGDWGSHKLAHELSTYCGVPHGAALAVIFPAWMKYVYKADAHIFRRFAVRVFDVDPGHAGIREVVLEGIDRLVSFYNSLGLTVNLTDLGVGEEAFEEMAHKAMLFGPIGRFMQLDRQDILNIFHMAL